MNQLYIYIYPHISSLLLLPPTFPIPPLKVVTKHGADLPVLCGCFPLAICFTFGSVYMSMPLSHRPSLPFPLPVSSSPFCTSASLFLSCPYLFLSNSSNAIISMRAFLDSCIRGARDNSRISQRTLNLHYSSHTLHLPF